MRPGFIDVLWREEGHLMCKKGLDQARALKNQAHGRKQYFFALFAFSPRVAGGE
jgi:hypothetical protein